MRSGGGRNAAGPRNPPVVGHGGQFLFSEAVTALARPAPRRRVPPGSGPAPAQGPGPSSAHLPGPSRGLNTRFPPATLPRQPGPGQQPPRPAGQLHRSQPRAVRTPTPRPVFSPRHPGRGKGVRARPGSLSRWRPSFWTGLATVCGWWSWLLCRTKMPCPKPLPTHWVSPTNRRDRPSRHWSMPSCLNACSSSSITASTSSGRVPRSRTPSCDGALGST